MGSYRRFLDQSNGFIYTEWQQTPKHFYRICHVITCLSFWSRWRPAWLGGVCMVGGCIAGRHVWPGGHGREACVAGEGHVWLGVRIADGRGHVWLRGVRGPPVRKRAVRTLLECWLVHFYIKLTDNRATFQASLKMNESIAKQCYLLMAKLLGRCCTKD